MGIYTSSEEQSNITEHSNLHNDIMQYKNEMEEFKKNIISTVDNYSNNINNKNAELEDLKKQIYSLQCINEQLEQKLREEKNKITMESKTEHQLSKLQIDAFVDQLLQDTSVNIKYLPDAVEKQIYKNMFNILIGLINNTLDTTSIKFLNHEIKFTIIPQNNINDVNNKTEELPKENIKIHKYKPDILHSLENKFHNIKND